VGQNLDFIATQNLSSGICHLCGSNGELTFEHVLPRSAFNHNPVISISYEQAFKLQPEEKLAPGSEARYSSSSGGRRH
jgi:hypothetical protein